MEGVQQHIPRNFEGIIKKHQDKPGFLLGVLEELQEADEYKYLSEAVLRSVSERCDIPLSRVYSVASFYSFFNLEPQGKHSIVVCRGTACHTRGSLSLLREAAAQLGYSEFKEEEESSFTTDDRLFTIKTVACFGQCALAPVVSVDGIIHSRMTLGALNSLLAKLKKEAGR